MTVRTKSAGMAMAFVILAAGLLWALGAGQAAAQGKPDEAVRDRINDVGQRIERTASGPLRVGMAMADITPGWPALIPYGKAVPVSARYGDPCYARAVVFEVGGLKVVFLELDIIGIRIDYADAVRDRIEKETGIGRDFVIVAATHNHAYPRIADRREKDRDRIKNLLVERSAVAVKEALAGMFEARIGVGKTTLRRDIVNNREKLMGPTLTDLYVIRIDDLAGDLRGALYDFGAHPVLFTKSWGDEAAGEIGPDWPGYASSYIQAKWRLRMLMPEYTEVGKTYPRGLFTMFAMGAAGDQVGLGKGPTVEEKDGVRMPPVQVMAETIGDHVLSLIEKTATTNNVKMTFRAKVFELSFLKKLPDSPYWKRSPATLVQALTFSGDTGLLMIPGELTAEMGIRLREGSGLENCIIVTQANDAIGYITSQEEALEALTYAGKGSGFDDTRGPVIAEEVLKLVNPSYAAGPPFDPAKGFGRISGKVSCPGDRLLVVGVQDTFELPSGGGDEFWGKRVLVDGSGNYTIDGLLPGKKFVYVREVNSKAALDTEGHEGRTFFYGRQVPVRAEETTSHVDFFIPKDLFATGIKGLNLDEDALRAEGNMITGRVVIDGQRGKNEPVVAELYVYGVQNSDPGPLLAVPYLTVLVSPGGEFRFEGVPPGRYVVASWVDVNRNGYPEPGVDLVAGPSQKVLEVH